MKGEGMVGGWNFSGCDESGGSGLEVKGQEEVRE